MPKNLNTPLVSVIIPTYNRAWALKKAIDSVLEQDYKNFELIVVDDGSTDDTEALIKAYEKSVKFIQQPNLGVSAARNKGIAVSSGALVAFLDSDDYWYPEKLSAQVEFFNANPDALICQTEEIWIRNGKKVNPKKKHQKLSGMIFIPSLALCLISPSAVMMRKNLFAKIDAFDESLPACEDYDLWLRITCRYPVQLIDTPLTVKTGGHEDQLSSTTGLDKYRIYALKKILKSDFLSESQYQATENMLKKKCMIYADGCMKHGRKTVATYYYRLAEEIETKGKKADSPED
ncbi:MAG: glycosyltransferase [Desulfobacteraceae bacterium]|nr:glycosyltransferase [Desulfobacteraceae bacterium]MBC2755618.1 glycosyltransferase [Desulfobacteraceae bacterium]